MPAPSEEFRFAALNELVENVNRGARLIFAVGTLFLFTRALEASGNHALTQLYHQFSQLLTPR